MSECLYGHISISSGHNVNVEKKTVVFLVFDGMNQLDVSGPAQVFAEASQLGAGYQLSYVSPNGTPAQSSIGATFVAQGSVMEVLQADNVVIPGGAGVSTAPIAPGLMTSVEHLARVSSRVVSVCTGAFLVASTGLLANRRVTTHWQHASRLGRIYPNIKVSPDALFIQDGKFHTSAGVTAGIDLALSLVERDHGSDLAREVAQQLVVYMQRQGGQSQYSTMLQFPRGDSTNVRAVIGAVTTNPAAPHSTESMAQIARVSPRHLVRLFKAEVGTTPARYLEQVRLETAKALLLRGDSVTNAARRAGFGSTVTMRRIFVSRISMPPSAYKERFTSTSAGHS